MSATITAVPPTFARAALAYAAQRIPVFPVHGTDDAGRCTCRKPDCAHPGKHPLTPHGLLDASTDLDTIAAWWQRWPFANPAVPTGTPSRLYVVDIDSKTPEGARIAGELARDLGLLADTTLIATPGKAPDYVPGLHIWLWSDADQRTASLCIGELKGTGGYVLVPPARRAGRPYRVLSKQPLTVADPIDWTSDLLALWDVTIPGRAPGPQRGDGWAADWLRTPLTAGNRRAPGGIPAIVGYLRGKRIDYETAVAIVELWDARNPEPLGPEEVRRQVEGMYARYGHPGTAAIHFPDVQPFEYRAGKVVKR